MYIAGCEAAELVGLICNLSVLAECISCWESAVVYLDNKNGVNHVGDHDRVPVLPSTDAGCVLYPLIWLAIRNVENLRDLGKYVIIKHLPRVYNTCDVLARQCMRNARDRNWNTPEDEYSQFVANVPILNDCIEAVEVFTREKDAHTFDRHRAMQYGCRAC